MKKPYGLWLLTLMTLLGACQKELKDELPATAQVNVKIGFRAVVNGQPLALGATYGNSAGEAYSVSTFRYYISGIDLVNTDSGLVYHLTPGVYVVDAADSASGLVISKAALRRYNGIALTIGVDSAKNVSGAQTGALDPARGMFWTWNSGYIMAKLEGNADVSGEPDHKFEYHIGGFRQPYNTIKRVLLPFPPGQTTPLLPNSTSDITITANVGTWFSGPNPVRIATTPVCTTPGDLAAKIAENYSGMLRIAAIVNN